MAYYISINYGQEPMISNDVEGGSAPSAADVYVAIGTGGQPVSNMSRDSICQLLQSIENYIRSDDPHKGGANVLAGLTP
ncbi:MAG TPA: hypothetical protein VFA81_10690 [Burkholderiales bacterium]|nr:hypothetical protein [Burkholderiales bacterium]